MIQQAYEYVSSSLWLRSTFFKLKITNIMKSSGWGLEKSESGVFFLWNYQPTKFQWSALYIGQDSSIYILEFIYFNCEMQVLRRNKNDLMI